MFDFEPLIQEMVEELVEFRHDLHAHPELGYEERRTAGRVVAELSKLSHLRITDQVAGTGVVAVLNGEKAGPCVALRADLDALPLTEKTGLPYASKTPGRMHACGHDGHITCLVGAARVLDRIAEQLPGVVKFIFQPAEEGGAGGRRMVEAGVLDHPRVGAAFALHGWPDLAFGTAAVTAGPMLAASEAFEIRLSGRGTHAAYPHRGTDVVLAAAHLITTLHAVRGRRVDPMDPAVISVTQVTAGDTHNIIPDTCLLRGTVRALRQGTHQDLRAAVAEIVEGLPRLLGVEAELTWLEPYPALVNDAACVELVAEAAAEVLGPENIDRHAPAGMGAEDFAFIAQEVPAAWYQLGLCSSGVEHPPGLHHPQFDFADAAIPLGVEMHCVLASRFLAAPPTWKCG